MNRDELEHLLRAAGSVLRQEDFIVVGSQSILGWYARAPLQLLESMEADLYVAGQTGTEKENNEIIIEGVLGETSQFHETFGYYADAVSEHTSTLPQGWEARTRVIDDPNTRGVRGHCLEPHDLAVAKYVAGREKDLRFLQGLADYGLLDAKILNERLACTEIPDEKHAAIRGTIRRQFARAQRLEQITQALVRARRAEPHGAPCAHVQANGRTSLVWQYDGNERALGRIEDGQEMSVVLARAGLTRREDVPQLELTLERERRNEMAKARAKTR